MSRDKQIRKEVIIFVEMTASNYQEDLRVLVNNEMKVKGLVAQLCLTLCHPVDCSQPDSSVHGILQARILEWVAIPLLQEIFPTQGIEPKSPAW